MKITLNELNPKQVEMEVTDFPFYVDVDDVKFKVTNDKWVGLKKDDDGCVQICIMPFDDDDLEDGIDIEFGDFGSSQASVSDPEGFESLLRELKDMVLSV